MALSHQVIIMVTDRVLICCFLLSTLHGFAQGKLEERVATWNLDEGPESFVCSCVTPITNDTQFTGLIVWSSNGNSDQLADLAGSVSVNASYVTELGLTVIMCLVDYDNFTVARSCMTTIYIEGTEIDSQKVGHGIRNFLIFLLLSGITLALLCMIKRNKLQIHLCIRDSCTKPQRNNEKAYDAYISIAGDGELKYVERNFVGALQHEHGYKFFIDEENLLEQLEYSDRLRDTIHMCNRFIIVLTPSYMNNDWCMYCFAEGFRKLLDLQVPIMLVISDHVIREEIKEANRLVNSVETILIPHVQSDREKSENLLLIRQFLAAPIGSAGSPQHEQDHKLTSVTSANGGGRGTSEVRQPILKLAEDMDRTSNVILTNNLHYRPNDKDTSSLQGRDENNGGDDEDGFEFVDEMADPNEVQVKEYRTQKDFYSLTGAAGAV